MGVCAVLIMLGASGGLLQQHAGTLDDLLVVGSPVLVQRVPVQLNDYGFGSGFTIRQYQRGRRQGAGLCSA